MLYSRFLELCAERKIAPSTLAIHLGFSRNAFSRWKETAEENNGFSSLRADTLMKLADYFGVSTDYLCGKSDRRDQSHRLRHKNPSIYWGFSCFVASLV